MGTGFSGVLLAIHPVVVTFVLKTLIPAWDKLTSAEQVLGRKHSFSKSPRQKTDFLCQNN